MVSRRAQLSSEAFKLFDGMEAPASACTPSPFSRGLLQQCCFSSGAVLLHFWSLPVTDLSCKWSACTSMTSSRGCTFIALPIHAKFGGTKRGPTHPGPSQASVHASQSTDGSTHAKYRQHQCQTTQGLFLTEPILRMGTVTYL